MMEGVKICSLQIRIEETGRNVDGFYEEEEEKTKVYLSDDEILKEIYAKKKNFNLQK
jgi:hypothetical protein